MLFVRFFFILRLCCYVTLPELAFSAGHFFYIYILLLSWRRVLMLLVMKIIECLNQFYMYYLCTPVINMLIIGRSLIRVLCWRKKLSSPMRWSSSNFLQWILSIWTLSEFFLLSQALFPPCNGRWFCFARWNFCIWNLSKKTSMQDFIFIVWRVGVWVSTWANIWSI